MLEIIADATIFIATVAFGSMAFVIGGWALAQFMGWWIDLWED